jgi:hypothetical protein
MPDSIWPNDVALDPRELTRDSPHQLVCFLLSPFSPQEIYDEVHEAVTAVCQACAKAAGVEIDCRRADTYTEAKPIHDDVWRNIAAADFLIVDVTGLNANVMIELGVAAAFRRPQQVILIRAADDSSGPLPFDAFAQRYLPYRRGILGDREFFENLMSSMIYAITPAPYCPPTNLTNEPSFLVDLRQGDRPDLLLSPGLTHRRMTKEALEFGSFYVYRNSWLILGNREYSEASVRIRFRFSEIPKPNQGFVGISLRNHHFLANWGHMVCFNTAGHVWRTVPLDENGTYNNVDFADVPGFNAASPEFIDLSVAITDSKMSLNVLDLAGDFPISEMPYVFAAGKIRVSTSMCRIQLQEVEVSVP